MTLLRRYTRTAAGTAWAARPVTAAVQARPLAEITADVLTVVCPACAAAPTVPCHIPGLPGNHLARFAEAAHSGLIPMADMEAALAAAEPVFTSLTVIPGGAP